MSWGGLKNGLGELFNPPYLRDLTPDEREARRRRKERKHGRIRADLQNDRA